MKDTKTATTNKLSFRRFELKYILPAKLADAIIGSISSFVVPDSFTRTKDHYLVNSLYFDTADFLCYRQKEGGIKNRKKYRIRYYGKCEKKLTAPIFFEIKRKVGPVVIKSRVVINPKQMRKISFENWRKIATSYPEFFAEFYTDYKNLRLKPTLFICYKRKPYFSKYDSNFRVTFDYDIRAVRAQRINHKIVYAQNINHHDAVMEVKFNGVIPPWFSYIIKSNNLHRSSFSKYCNSLLKVYNRISKA